MKLKNLILFGLLFLTGTLNAQTDFRPGYIINQDRDTLYGEVDYRGPLLMGKICKFKNKESVVSEFFPNDISSFRFIDSKYYVSKEINHQKVFLEYLVKGKVNIYYLRDEVGDHYYIDKEGVPLTEIPYEEEIRYVDDRQVRYKTTAHIGVLKYYMQDAPELQYQINSMKKPEHQNLIKLAEDYHAALYKGEQYIVYEESRPLIKILPEFVGGVVRYSNVEDLKDKYYMNTGIIGHIWMPRANEKMYLRTGLIYSQFSSSGEKSNYYKIPVHIEYIYSKGVFRPRISYGLNFYIPSYRTVSFEIGTNVKLSEKVFLSATSDIEFDPNMLIVPKSLLSYSLQLGLFLNLN